MFDQNLPCTFDKIRETNSDEKCSHCLALRAKVKVIAKIKSKCPREQKTCLSKKIWSRGFLSSWCAPDADEDADISKTIFRPPP